MNRCAVGKDARLGSDQHSSANLRKYESSNCVVQFLLRRFLQQLTARAGECQAKRILDVGCGEGLAAQTLLRGLSGDGPPSYVGADVSFAALRVAAKSLPRARFSCMGADSLALRADTFDLVLCIEVLEHVQDPWVILEELRRVSSRYCVISVPHEPFFRWGNLLRGQHLQSWGDHPEHIHHWGPRSLHRMLSEFFIVKKLSRSFPWLIALCER